MFGNERKPIRNEGHGTCTCFVEQKDNALPEQVISVHVMSEYAITGNIDDERPLLREPNLCVGAVS